MLKPESVRFQMTPFLALVFAILAPLAIPDLAAAAQCSSSFWAASLDKSYRPIPVIEKVFVGDRVVPASGTTKPIRAVSVVVPVYNEFRNGNFLGIMKQVERQTAALKRVQVVHVILLVNNTPEIAKDPAHPVLKDNQEAIVEFEKLARLASSESKHRIHVPMSPSAPVLIASLEDLSTKGFERNMGRLRKLGQELAVERMRKQLKNYDPSQHILMSMDADTIWSDVFLQNTVDAFATSNEIDAQFAVVSYTPAKDLSPLGFKLYHHRYLTYALGHFYDVLTRTNHAVGGPQIAIRASATIRSGNRPGLQYSVRSKSGEDTDLAMRVYESGKAWIRNPHAQIRAEGRLRADGFEAAGFKKEIDLMEIQAGSPLEALKEFTLRPFEVPNFYEQLMAPWARKVSLELLSDSSLWYQRTIELHNWFVELDTHLGVKGLVKGQSIAKSDSQSDTLIKSGRLKSVRNAEAFEMVYGRAIQARSGIVIETPGTLFFDLIASAVKSFKNKGRQKLVLQKEVDQEMSRLEAVYQLVRKKVLVSKAIRVLAIQFYFKESQRLPIEHIKAQVEQNFFHPETGFAAAHDPFLQALFREGEASLARGMKSSKEMDKAYPNWLDPNDTSMEDFELIKALEHEIALATMNPSSRPALAAARALLANEFKQNQF